MKTNINDLGYKISKLTTTETDELVNILANKYGVFASIYPYPIGIMPIDNIDVKYDLSLLDVGNNKLLVLKTIKELFEIGLKESKDIVDSAPCYLKKSIEREEAENIKGVLELCGAKLEII